MDQDVAVRLAADIQSHVEDLLLAVASDRAFLYDPGTFISDERLMQVAEFSLRDLSRLEKDQDGHVSIAKCSGYVAFWFGKLKPLNSVYLATGESDPREVIDINEAVALSLSEILIWTAIYSNPAVAPAIWQTCPLERCSIRINDKELRGACFHYKNANYMTFSEGRYRNYLIYCIRYRPISPYFYVNHLEQSIYFSCESSSPKLYT